MSATVFYLAGYAHPDFNESGVVERQLVYDKTASGGALYVDGDDSHGSYVTFEVGSKYCFYTYTILEPVTVAGTVTVRYRAGTSNYGGNIRYTIGKRTAAGVETDLISASRTVSTTPTTYNLSATFPATDFDVGDYIYIYFEGSIAYGGSMTLSLSGGSSYGYVTLPTAVTAGNIVKSAAVYFNVLTAVAALGIIDYDTLELVAQDGLIDYHTLGQIAQLGIVDFNTLSNLAEVIAAGVIDYHTYNLVRVDGEFLYDTRVGVMQSMLHLLMWLSVHTDLDTRLSQHTILNLEEVA